YIPMYGMDMAFLLFQPEVMQKSQWNRLMVSGLKKVCGNTGRKLPHPPSLLRSFPTIVVIRFHQFIGRTFCKFMFLRKPMDHLIGFKSNITHVAHYSGIVPHLYGGIELAFIPGFDNFDKICGI